MSTTTTTFDFDTYTQSKLSLIIFGTYMLIAGGIGFCFFPVETLDSMGLYSTDDVFVRLVGVLLATLAINYFVMVYYSHVVYFKLSVIMRYLAAAFFVYLVFTNKAPANLLLFAVGDATGATWTLISLWFDSRASNEKIETETKTKPVESKKGK